MNIIFIISLIHEKGEPWLQLSQKPDFKILKVATLIQ